MKFDTWLLDKIFTPIAVLFRYLGVGQWNLCRNALIGGSVFIAGASFLSHDLSIAKVIVLAIITPLMALLVARDYRLVNLLSMSDSGPVIARDLCRSQRLWMTFVFFGWFLLFFRGFDDADNLMSAVGLIIYWSAHYFMAVILPPPPPPKRQWQPTKATSS